MRSHNHPIILFIDRNGFSVFQDTLADIPRFNFTPDVVANLDVVNKEQFTNLITTFIQINKITPSSLAVLLSDTVIYVKDLAQSQPNPALINGINKGLEQEHKGEIQGFLENVPFEEVLAKVIKTGETSRIVAANKDLIMTIAQAFTDKGSVMEAVIPSFMYGSNVNFAGGLTGDNARTVLSDPEIFKIGNLLTDQQKVISAQNTELEKEEKEKKPQNLRQYILVGVFVTLLVILAVVYFNLGASPTTPSKKIKSFSIPASTQAPVTTVPVALKNVKVKIVQNSQIDAKADNLRNELTKLGFQDIVNEVSQNSTSEKSSIIFSQGVPLDIKENLVLEIKKILPDIIILENQDSDLTIAILMGK